MASIFAGLSPFLNSATSTFSSTLASTISPNFPLPSSLNNITNNNNNNNSISNNNNSNVSNSNSIPTSQSSTSLSSTMQSSMSASLSSVSLSSSQNPQVSTIVGPLPSVDRVQQLTDLHEITLLLQDVIAHEKRIGSELQDFLQNRDQIEAKLEIIEILPTKLKPVYKEGKELAETIEITCGLASNVSRKVRDLDTTRERLRQATKKVEDIIDVKSCIDGVHQAMEKEDYETAAAHIERYLNIDASVLEEGSAAQLRVSEQNLKEIFSKKLEDAMKADDHESIIRFCKLFAPLGMKEEGLTKYSQYIKRVVNNESELVYKELANQFASAKQKGQEEDYMTSVNAITKLYETIAGIIEERQLVIDQHFGGISFVRLLTAIQEQCDKSTTKILDLILDHYNISKLVNEVISLKNFNGKERRDPRSLAHTLDMIAMLSQRTSLYERFVRTKAQNTFDAATGATSQKKPNSETTKPTSKRKLEGFPTVTELGRKMQEIMSQYITLEEYFMVESVQKAVRMDEQSGDGLTSSVVDHVFFVLQKSTHRSLSTANDNSACAIINLLNNCLNIDFKEVLQTMLRDKAVESSARSNQKATYMVVLNNLEVSSEYILKLKSELDTECEAIFGPIVEEKEKVKICLMDLLQTFKNFKQVLQDNLELVSKTISPRIRPLIDMFLMTNYELEELQFAENEINDPFIEKFITGLDTLFQPFKSNLTETNFDNLLHIVIQDIAGRMEKVLLQKTFNQLGGLQFDKDLRALVAYFSTNTQRTVRGEFARLSQMASLLNMEAVSEVLEYWGDKSGHMTWRLTPSEVRKVLSRRVDFKEEDIARLKL